MLIEDICRMAEESHDGSLPTWVPGFLARLYLREEDYVMELHTANTRLCSLLARVLDPMAWEQGLREEIETALAEEEERMQQLPKAYRQ